MDANFNLLSVTEAEHALFFSNERNLETGCVGHFRLDFGKDGNEFWTNWFDHDSGLMTQGFKEEFNRLVNHFREDKTVPLLKNRKEMNRYCYAHPDDRIQGSWYENARGFKVQTEQYSYYLRCAPQRGDYDLYIYAYDNSRLLPFLAGELPDFCYTTLKENGRLITLQKGVKGYIPTSLSTDDVMRNKELAEQSNKKLGISKAQVAAMECGSLFGWDVPAADPRNYDKNGKPVKPKHKDKER